MARRASRECQETRVKTFPQRSYSKVTGDKTVEIHVPQGVVTVSQQPERKLIGLVLKS